MDNVYCKKVEHINKTFRMPTELVKKPEVLAQEKRISLNNLVVQCCEYALENNDTIEYNTYQKPCNKL